MRKLLLILGLAVVSYNATAQGYVDQDKTMSLSNSQTGDIENVQKADWSVYDYKAYKKTDKKGPWTTLKSYLDSLPGGRYDSRLDIVELANRVTSDKLKTGRKLIVPTSFDEDYRAYSPYPFRYETAAKLPKLFIIDKYTQTFGAYEYGKLVRWGLVSAGRTDDLTPDGKYNFGWRAEYRESSAAPEGEVWAMRYMVNFDPRIGLHVHQYSLPIASAASHGCVRVSMADAIWNYNWADGSGEKKGTPVWVINHNPVGRPAHWEIGYNGKVHSLVRLPEDTYANRK